MKNKILQCYTLVCEALLTNRKMHTPFRLNKPLCFVYDDALEENQIVYEFAETIFNKINKSARDQAIPLFNYNVDEILQRFMGMVLIAVNIEKHLLLLPTIAMNRIMD